MIKVLTDTTASLSREEYQTHQIIPIPLILHENHQTKKDLFEISPQEFYRHQRSGRKFNAAQLKPEAFVETFEPLLNANHEIICILLSGRISECVNSALQAKNLLNTGAISIVDSRQSGFGQAYMAIKAREMAENGATREQIVEELKNLRSRTHSFFIIESLQHVLAGSRMYWDQALISSIFNIKPIISFDHSGKMRIRKKLSSIDNIRTKTLMTIREYAKRGIERAALHYTDNLEEATAFARELQNMISAPVQLVHLSPVFGVHTGPDLLGPCIITKS